MITVENVIPIVADGRPLLRDWTKLEGAAIHRVGVDRQTGVVLGYDAIQISDHFTGRSPTYPEVTRATGGELAYSIIIGGNLGPKAFDGRIWQTLPLDEIGAHARRFSNPYLGIGMIGDFRDAPPSSAQYAALVDLLALLCPAFGWDPFRAIRGHGEISGAHDGSKAPGKPAACPGDKLNLNVLRDDVATMIAESSRRQLDRAGLIFTGDTG